MILSQFPYQTDATTGCLGVREVRENEKVSGKCQGKLFSVRELFRGCFMRFLLGTRQVLKKQKVLNSRLSIDFIYLFMSSF